MLERTFTVPERGIGRRDYSVAIEYASQPTTRGRQGRNNWAAAYEDVPAIPFPFVYAMTLEFFDAEGVLTTAAPTLPINHLYHIGVSAKREALVVVGCYVYADLAHWIAWDPEKSFGWVYGYGKAELAFVNGVKTEPGKYYDILFAEYSGEAAFDIFILVNGLEEEVVYA